MNKENETQTTKTAPKTKEFETMSVKELAMEIAMEIATGIMMIIATCSLIALFWIMS